MTALLIDLSDRYASATSMSRSRISTIVFNDGKALDRIASGGDLTTRTYEKALLWFSSNWPESARWPDAVARPDFAAPAPVMGQGAAA